MAQYAELEDNVYIHANDDNVFIRSLRNVNDTVHTGGPGEFTIRSRPLGNRLVVRSNVGNNFEILTYNNLLEEQNRPPYSFEIGYENVQRMAIVSFECVPHDEQLVLGRYQLVINNTWRITSGQPQHPNSTLNRTASYVMNIPISQTVHSRYIPLFRVVLNRRVPEPQRISIRIRPNDFATMFFASGELMHIRFNGDYLINIYTRIQRVFVPHNDRAVVPIIDRRNMGVEEVLLENLRRYAFQAPRENLQIFRQLVQLGIDALDENMDIAHINARLNRYLDVNDEQQAILQPPQIDYVDDDV